MLKENNKVLKCSNASPDWRGYVDFVNNVVVDGLSRVICASLGYLLDQVLTKHDREFCRFSSCHPCFATPGLSFKLVHCVLCGDAHDCQNMASF